MSDLNKPRLPGESVEAPLRLIWCWDFPGAPLAETLCSQCREHAFHPESSTRIPYATGRSQKKKKTYLVLVEFFPRGKGRPLAIDLKELGLRNMLSRSHQGSLFLSLPV